MTPIIRIPAHLLVDRTPDQEEIYQHYKRVLAHIQEQIASGKDIVIPMPYEGQLFELEFLGVEDGDASEEHY